MPRVGAAVVGRCRGPALQLDHRNGNPLACRQAGGPARPLHPDRCPRRHVTGVVHQLVVTIVSDHAAIGTVLRWLTAGLSVSCGKWPIPTLCESWETPGS
jgi:hypothetical protein